MNHRSIWAIGLLLMAGLAFATGGGDDDDQSQSQGQEQDQHQGQAQGQQQETVVTVAGATASVNHEAQGDYKVDFRNNPNVYTNPPMPTVPCYKTGGFGASGGGVGLSLGGGKIDPYCTEREEIRLGHAIGMEFASTWRWCNLENNVRVFGSAEACLSASTAKLSPEYHLLMTEKERLERELRETKTIMAARCAAAEEAGDRAEEAWLACQNK